MQGRHENNTWSLPGHIQDHSLYRAYSGAGTSWPPTSASPVATALSAQAALVEPALPWQKNLCMLLSLFWHTFPYQLHRACSQFCPSTHFTKTKGRKGRLVGNLERMLSLLLSSGGQESSSTPPVFTWQPVHLCDSTQGSSAAEDLVLLHAAQGPAVQQHG